MSFFLIKSFLKTAKKQFFTPKFFFSQTDTVYNNPAEKSDPTILSLMEYKEAIQSFHSENYIKSEELFKRILTILENSSQNKSDSYIHILKKLAVNSNMLRKYQNSENIFEKIIEINRERKSSEIVIYNEFQNLIVHCLRTNLNKAILISKALLSESEKKNMPLNYQKTFLFDLGTAYLLKGNYVDSKTRLRECLNLDPNNKLRGFALNNLALASWWHKVPLDSIEPSENEKNYTLTQIDNDYKFVIPLFKKAISYIEEVETKNDEQKLLFNNLLNPDVISQKDFNQMILENKDSQKPLMNIGEFLFLTQPNNRNEASYWFKYSLKFFEKLDPQNIDRCLIFLALFCKSSSQFIKAEGLFRKTLEMIDKNENYNKVLCLNLYGKMLIDLPNRSSEGENFIQQSKNLTEKLPFWENKIQNVCLPDLEIN